MESIIEFIQEHGLELWGVWGAILTIAFFIVKLTPTDTDDKVLKTIMKVLTALGLNPHAKKEEDKKEEAKKELEEEINERDDDRTRNDLTNTLR